MRMANRLDLVKMNAKQSLSLNIESPIAGKGSRSSNLALKNKNILNVHSSMANPVVKEELLPPLK